jgi:hypothetical protein
VKCKIWNSLLYHATGISYAVLTLHNLCALTYFLSYDPSTRNVRNNYILYFYFQILITFDSKFKVCKSVLHRTIQINHQPDATVFQFIIPTFIYSSTCFGHFPAHPQEQWLQWQPLVLPSYGGDSRAVSVVRPAGLITNTARQSPRYEGKTRDCHCSQWAPDDGRENARNMLSCK